MTSREYVVYAAAGGSFTVDLSAARNTTLEVHWCNPRTGQSHDSRPVAGGNATTRFAPSKNADDTHTLAVEFPVDGSLTVHVPERSSRGDPILQVQIDGTNVLSESLPLDTEAAWSYWNFFTMSVPAGAHRIRISNTGSGTFWTACELGNYRLRQGPDLDIQGLQTNDYILLWARNPQSIWLCDREGRKPEPQPPGRLTLKNVRDGRYSVTWRDTITNDVAVESDANAENGRLTVDTPAVSRSTAARIVRTAP